MIIKKNCTNNVTVGSHVDNSPFSGKVLVGRASIFCDIFKVYELYQIIRVDIEYRSYKSSIKRGCANLLTKKGISEVITEDIFQVDRYQHPRYLADSTNFKLESNASYATIKTREL